MEKKKIESFEDLRVWQKGIELVKQIYLLTAAGRLRGDFGLRDQLQRAAVSIPTNVAEGFERSSRTEITAGECPTTVSVAGIISVLSPKCGVLSAEWSVSRS